MSGLYNLLHGVNAQLAILVSPFLPRRADQFPRFRDVFTSADDSPVKGDIYVYTRMGGGNRRCWDGCSEEKPCLACDAYQVERDPTCIRRYDDDGDSTYSTFVFRVADEHRADFDVLVSGGFDKLSSWYFDTLRQRFADSEKITEFISALETSAKEPTP